MDIGFYNEHGYLHIKNALPKEYIQTARDKGLPLVKWSRENLGKPSLAGPDELFLHVGCAGAYEEDLYKLYTSELSYDLATTILGRKEIFLFNDQMVYKFPNDNFSFGEHCDNQFGGENKDGKMHTVNMSWILDDFTDENGTLELQSLKTKEWTKLYPKAGDIIAINGNCIHRSGPNESDKPRGLYACVYSEGQINLGNYYTDPFLPKPSKHQNGNTFWKNIPAQQVDTFKEYFTMFFKLNKFDRILELGTSRGGLTYFLSSIFKGPIVTVDNNLENINKRVFKIAEVIEADHMSQKTIKSLHEDFISKEGRVLVLCDGGDKPAIFNAYAKLIKEDDYIGVHDFFISREAYDAQTIWHWLECTEDQIADTLTEFELKKTDTYMLDIVWGMYKKVGAKINIPHSFYPNHLPLI